MTPEMITAAARRVEPAPVGAPPEPPRSRSLLDVFAATTSRCADRVAVDGPDGALSYRELSEAAEQLAARLSALGVGPGDRVGVRVASGTAQLYVAILGAMHAGAAYVPVDADDPPARAAAVWDGSGACAVIEDGLAITQLGPPGGGDRELSLDDDAWIIFTSGSTGKPKGVAVSHRAAAAFVDAEARLWGVEVHDRVLAGLSVGFDASCEEIWLAWRHGAALVPASRADIRSGAEFGPWLKTKGITVISTVPSLVAMWDEDAIADVRLLILGGEACPEGLAWRLSEDREVWNTYGPTEATVVSTATRVRPGEPVTIGWPLDGWQVAVVDERGEPVSLGERGELVVGGVGLARYLDPALDAQRFAEVKPLGWQRAYRTGDIVRETANGFDFVGRSDDQVKLHGRRIELGEIDAQLNAAPGVLAAAAALRTTEAGNRILVGYVVGDVDTTRVRARVTEQLPDGIAPLVVRLDALPRGSSGKVDRRALPWPPPSTSATQGPAQDPDAAVTETSAWLAQQWADQLGPVPMSADSDFFELGGSSLAAAKLVSALRQRFPAVAVADIYAHRRLGELATRLDRLGVGTKATAQVRGAGRRRWGAAQLAGVLLITALMVPDWLLGIFSVDHYTGSGVGSGIGWGWLIAGWLLFTSAPGRAVVVLIARRVLLGRLRPGRYSRHSWLALRITFLERLAAVARLNSLAGTPAAPTYARISGAQVGRDARLATLPPPTALVRIGDGATIESDVDLHGWWFEGDDLVIGELHIGPGARIGARSLLMPGAEIGAGAEIEPGAVVTGKVPAGERWSGSPARRDGRAGESWPTEPAPQPGRWRVWQVMYGVGLVAQNLFALVAAIPTIVLLTVLGPADMTLKSLALTMLTYAPLFAACFLVSYGLLTAAAIRVLWRLVRPGWHPDEGATGWAMWMSENLLTSAKSVLFPLYASIYTRSWLRLLGVKVGRGIEMSTAGGLSPLLSYPDLCFAADEVFFAHARARGGWLHVSPIEIGEGTFLGNGAILKGETKLGPGNLVGIETAAPAASAPGSSWFGCPALELPRVPDRVDPSRTTHPPRRLKLARGLVEIVRFLLPSTLSVLLIDLVLLALGAIAAGGGVVALAAAIPLVLVGAGLVAIALTVAAKWLIMGRYRPGERPFWSFYVWRDEIVNSCQEQLAGAWLLNAALGTPLMSAYLRVMGTKVGKDVWCETLTITEFDLVHLADGCVVNRGACVMTHLVHDRLLRTGPTTLEPGSTMGPTSAVLPDTRLGAGCSLGWRSVVMRGEELPAGTRWHGSPVVSV